MNGLFVAEAILVLASGLMAVGMTWVVTTPKGAPVFVHLVRWIVNSPIYTVRALAVFCLTIMGLFVALSGTRFIEKWLPDAFWPRAVFGIFLFVWFVVAMVRGFRSFSHPEQIGLVQETVKPPK